MKYIIDIVNTVGNTVADRLSHPDKIRGDIVAAASYTRDKAIQSARHVGDFIKEGWSELSTAPKMVREYVDGFWKDVKDIRAGTISKERAEALGIVPRVEHQMLPEWMHSYPIPDSLRPHIGPNAQGQSPPPPVAGRAGYKR